MFGIESIMNIANGELKLKIPVTYIQEILKIEEGEIREWYFTSEVNVIQNGFLEKRPAESQNLANLLDWEDIDEDSKAMIQFFKEKIRPRVLLKSHLRLIVYYMKKGTLKKKSSNSWLQQYIKPKDNIRFVVNYNETFEVSAKEFDEYYKINGKYSEDINFERKPVESSNYLLTKVKKLTSKIIYFMKTKKKKIVVEGKFEWIQNLSEEFFLINVKDLYIRDIKPKVFKPEFPIKRRAETPKQNAITPKKKAIILKRKAQTPKRNPETPKITPEILKRKADTPKQNTETPIVNPEILKRKADTPKRNTETPIVNPEILKRKADTPKRNAETPLVNPEILKRKAETPKRSFKSLRAFSNTSVSNAKKSTNKLSVLSFTSRFPTSCSTKNKANQVSFQCCEHKEQAQVYLAMLVRAKNQRELLEEKAKKLLIAQQEEIEQINASWKTRSFEKCLEINKQLINR